MEQARALVYHILETIFESAPDAAKLRVLREHEALAGLASFSEGASMIVSGLHESPSDEDAAEHLSREYRRLFFGPGAIPVPLWESVYRDREHVLFGEQTIQVRNAYAEFGLQYVHKNNQPEDHLAVELNFMVWLIHRAHEAATEDERARYVEAQERFLDGHLCRWADRFAELLFAESECRYYRGAAQLLLEILSLDQENRLGEKEEEGVC